MLNTSVNVVLNNLWRYKIIVNSKFYVEKDDFGKFNLYFQADRGRIYYKKDIESIVEDIYNIGDFYYIVFKK